ncbi:uncharacterized protein TNCV_1756961 [Trichonephila clavipes]|nr:uncharacterized protein TNCV_1756961 [Trichonephila clavipes]
MATGSYLTQNHSRSQSEIQGDLHKWTISCLIRAKVFDVARTEQDRLDYPSPEHHWYQCSCPGGSLAHGFTRQDQTLLVRIRSGNIRTKKFSKGRKSFEMCTNCSSEPPTPGHILECLGLLKQDLAGVGLFENIGYHGPGLALLTHGGVQQQ